MRMKDAKEALKEEYIEKVKSESAVKYKRVDYLNGSSCMVCTPDEEGMTLEECKQSILKDNRTFIGT